MLLMSYSPNLKTELMEKLQTSTFDSNVGTIPITRNPSVGGGFVTINDTEWYKITNSHLLPPFFLSLVSSGNHWMFVASNGALSAGRQNPESSLFPVSYTHLTLPTTPYV